MDAQSTPRCVSSPGAQDEMDGVAAMADARVIVFMEPPANGPVVYG
jgi:hypothetical protein